MLRPLWKCGPRRHSSASEGPYSEPVAVSMYRLRSYSNWGRFESRVKYWYSAPRVNHRRNLYPIFNPTDLVSSFRSNPWYLSLTYFAPISDVTTLTEIVDRDTASRAAQLRVLGAFAAIAFVLAGIGIHGLLSFAVSQREQEIGVRMALGAQSSDILGMVMRRCLMLTVAGVVPGVALAYAAGRSMQALLAGVAPADALTLAAAVGLVVVMTFAGSVFPTLRALRVNPITAIRAE